MQLYAVNRRPSDVGDSTWFTGSVWLDELAVAPAPSALRVHRVSFAPGARTFWHSHPVGQILHAVSGVGLVGSTAGTRHLLPGETAWIPPGEAHWHGAAPNQFFVHLAIQEADKLGAEATWLEPVNEADYRRPPGEHR